MTQDSSSIANQLVLDLIRERRAERRWKNIRFFLIFAFIAFVAFGFFSRSDIPALVGDETKGYVSFLRLQGTIAPGQEFSSSVVLPLLQEAFADKNSKGVVLDINSGGGTPVQAAIIHDAILDLKKRYHKKIVAVGEDMMTSGAYYVAVAADKIYVNPSSLTGSIGVIMKDFGFPELLKKIGVERRVYSSGDNKDRLDPFLPQTIADVDKIKQVMNEVHGSFELAVEQGRKGRLHGDLKKLFSGDFWSGTTAVKLGLVDDLGNLSDVLKKEFHVNSYRDYSAEPSFLKNVIGQFASSLRDLPVSGSSVQLLEQA